MVDSDVADVVPVVAETVGSSHVVAIGIGDGAIEVNQQLNRIEGTKGDEENEKGDEENGHVVLPFYGSNGVS